MTIQWYPGHMAKARREAEERLKRVDFVMELVDARAPYSSQNPMLNEMIIDKPKMTILMKSDLANKQETHRWMHYFQSENGLAVSVDANNKADINRIIQAAREFSHEKHVTLKQKGIQKKIIRAMIIGIPNVGKSTLINRLANKKAAKIGDHPGITKQQTWIKVGDEYELLDTPGI